MIYGGFSKVENGQLTGDSQWGLTYDDVIMARANGWFPDVRDPAPSFDPLTSRLIETKTLRGDIVAVSYSVAELTDDEANTAKRIYLLRQLAETDSAFSARWIEDLSNGLQYKEFSNWKATRANLRQQLSQILAVRTGVI